jgi:hypothetical protein
LFFAKAEHRDDLRNLHRCRALARRTFIPGKSASGRLSRRSPKWTLVSFSRRWLAWFSRQLFS